jgi:hypothetical protein
MRLFGGTLNTGMNLCVLAAETRIATMISAQP